MRFRRRGVDEDIRCRQIDGHLIIGHRPQQGHILCRIGIATYAEENQSYGLTTLRARDLDLAGTKLRFTFSGKSGKEWSLQLSDRRIANTVRRLQDLPGQRLFRYLDAEGKPNDVHSHDVNAYMRAAMGEDFTSKHFRTPPNRRDPEVIPTGRVGHYSGGRTADTSISTSHAGLASPATSTTALTGKSGCSVVPKNWV